MANPSSSGRTDGLTLSVHPSVVFRLGEEMIQDDVQAIVELAKNAYDADSASARIVVDTQSLSAVDGRLINTASDADGGAVLRGEIVVKDRGTGMTREEIIQSWLTVSGSQKRDLKARGKTTFKRRTPVGDKGLGRLGTQRLGRVLDLYTVVRGSGVAHRLTIPWDAYASADRLDSVKFTLTSEPAGREAHGTTLRIRGLRSPDNWHGPDGVELERQLAAMISPFGNRGFRVTLNIDGQAIDLRERPRAVRANAMLRYELDYRHGVLSITGTMTQDFFRPDRSGADRRATYEQTISADQGKAFLSWLLTRKKAHVDSLGFRPDPDGYIAFAAKFPLAEMDGVPRSEGKLVDPGSFSGEIDMVRLREDAPSVFDSASDYRAFLKEINGVRIYRDGFGIPVSKDWLNLASRWTTGSSFYNLRPENVIGFIDLSAANNPGLEETSSREKFRDTPAYRSFLTIMERWLKYTDNAQSFVRRGYNDYLRELAAADVDVSEASTPSLLIEQSNRQDAQTRALLVKLQAARGSASSALAAAESQQNQLGDTLFRQEVKSLQDAAKQIRSVLSTIDQLSTDVEGLRATYGRQRSALIVLREQFDAVQGQLSEAWETVALGLTAEALSHEVSQITDRLRRRTQALLRGLRPPIREVVVRAYAEHVMSSTAALTRQLGHLNPALRYRREHREQVTMSVALNEIATHFNTRWKDLDYRIYMVVTVKDDFTININPGRLTQVLDNLILNSEYWIRSQQASEPGRVIVMVDQPSLVVSDNGPGVDPSLEGMIFDPFVSGKRRNGRGLGLFVIRQLLEPEAATVELSPERSSDGRRRVFVIEFESSHTQELV